MEKAQQKLDFFDSLKGVPRHSFLAFYFTFLVSR